MADRRILIAALILGAIAAGLAVAFLASAGGGSGEPAPAAEARSVVVARQEIPPGTKITEEMVEISEIPASAVIANAATDLEVVVGETARYPIAQGEQINAVRLVAPVEVQALSFQIPQGMRGYTIPVSTSQSPAALLAPGDFVDILVASTADNIVTPDTVLTSEEESTAVEGGQVGDDRQAVATILQNVQVLSVQREYVANGVPYDPSVRGTPPEDEGISWVTLSVTPEQAQLLWLASQEGKLTFTLRAFGDDQIGNIGPVSGPVRIEQ